MTPMQRAAENYNFSSGQPPPPPNNRSPSGFGMEEGSGNPHWMMNPPNGGMNPTPQQQDWNAPTAAATSNSGFSNTNNPQQSSDQFSASNAPQQQPARFHQSPPVDPNPNLYIHNVPKDATEGELRDLFSAFGKVERIRLKVNQKIGPQALYAFVTFQTTAEAQTALERLNGFDMRTRKLRIEFQRSRSDEDRQADYNNNNNNDDRYQDRPRASDRRKRGGSSSGFSSNQDHYANDYYGDQESSSGPPLKRARYFESDRDYGSRGQQRGGHAYYGNDGSRHHHHHHHPSSNQPSGGSSSSYNNRSISSASPGPGPYPRHQHPPAGASPYDMALLSNRPFPPSAWKQQPKITVFLCDIISRIKPYLFSDQYLTPSSAGVLPTPQKHDQQEFQPQQQQQQQPKHHPQQQLMAQQAPQMVSNQVQQHPTSGIVVQQPTSCVDRWLGLLARNNKRKVPVEITRIEGPIENFLTQNVNFLNISHRSSFEDVAKKPATAACFIRVASQEISESGVSGPVTPQKRESHRKGFSDHVEYLTAKGRSGVITLTDKKQLYIIPAGVPLFDGIRKGATPPDSQVLIGLFTNALVSASPHAPVAASGNVDGPVSNLMADSHYQGRGEATQQSDQQHQNKPVQQTGFQVDPNANSIQQQTSASLMNLLANQQFLSFKGLQQQQKPQV